MDTKNNRIVKEAISAVDNYRGDNAAGYHLVGSALIDLENAIKQEFGITDGNATEQQEKFFILRHGGEELSLNDLLARAEEARSEFTKRLLSGDVGGTEAEKSGVVALFNNTVFLPPKPGEAPFTRDGKKESFVPKFASRTQDVLKWLTGTEINGRRIFLSDLVIHLGAVDPKQIRRVSYSIIDVTPLGLQIAVCDQLEQAMFVLPKSANTFSVLDWARTSKAELVESHGAMRIIMTEKWPETLAYALKTFQGSRAEIEPLKCEIGEIKATAKSGFIEITPKVKHELESLKTRVGYGPRKVFQTLTQQKKLPSDLTEPMISSLLNGNMLSVRLDYLRAVLDCLSGLPVIGVKVKLDDKIPESERTWVDEFSFHNKRTGLGSRRIIKLLGKDCPNGLTEKIIHHWSYVKTKADGTFPDVSLNDITAVIELLKKQPDAHKKINLDDKMPESESTWREEIVKQIKRTGISGTGVIERMNTGDIAIPDGLSNSIIFSWTEVKQGSYIIHHAREDYINAAMKVWEATPDRGPLRAMSKKPPAIPKSVGEHARITLDDKMPDSEVSYRQKLFSEQNRTRLAGTQIVRILNENGKIPQGLLPSTIDDLNKPARRNPDEFLIKTLSPDYYYAIIGVLESAPNYENQKAKGRWTERITSEKSSGKENRGATRE
jgi:hypothetical protein